MEYYRPKRSISCLCGCGEMTTPGKRYRRFHHRNKPGEMLSGARKQKPKRPERCRCGCGEEAPSGRKYIHGHSGGRRLQGKRHKRYPPEFRDPEFRRSILERDEHRCQAISCKGKSKNLQLHHMDWNRFNNDKNNIITLCKACHFTLHNHFIANIIRDSRPGDWLSEITSEHFLIRPFH